MPKSEVKDVVKELTGRGAIEVTQMLTRLPCAIKIGVPKEEAEQIKRSLEEAGATVTLKFEGADLESAASAPASQPVAELTQAADDIPTQIKKLAELKEAGILSESEFETKKQELLGRMYPTF